MIYQLTEIESDADPAGVGPCYEQLEAFTLPVKGEHWETLLGPGPEDMEVSHPESIITRTPRIRTDGVIFFEVRDGGRGNTTSFRADPIEGESP